MRLLVNRLVGVLVVAAVTIATPSTASAVDNTLCLSVTKSSFSCTYHPKTVYEYQFDIFLNGSKRGSVSFQRLYKPFNAWKLVICDHRDPHGAPQARIDPGDGRVLPYAGSKNGCRTYSKGYAVRKWKVAWAGHTTEWRPPPLLFR